MRGHCFNAGLDGLTIGWTSCISGVSMSKVGKVGRMYARALRVRQTEAEQYFWRIVRDRALGGFKFRRQHPVGPYVLDFYCAAARLAVELDGGGHSESEQRDHDTRRDAFLAGRGIAVRRYWNHELFEETEAVLEELWKCLVARTEAR